MRDVARPEAPIVVLQTPKDYQLAVKRARELSDAHTGSPGYLELVALRAAVTRWESQHHLSPQG